jgi:hypothetical protein
VFRKKSFWPGGKKRMQVPKWYVIAKNEYRIRTSSIRKIRSYLLYVIFFLLAIYIVFLVPAITRPLFDVFEIPDLIISVAALAMLQVVLFTFFIWFLIIPIANTLKEEQADQLETLLSSPIKPSDLLLGKFLGQLPFYAVIITIVAGFVTGLLIPLGLDLLQITITIITIILVLVTAEWLGTLIAALLKTRLSKSAKGKDIGKGLSLIIALPMVALMYAVMGGGVLEALGDPNTNSIVKALLAIFPSSWGINAIVGFARHPGDWSAVWFNTLINFGGLLLFFLGSLYVGAKVANRAYSLETTSFSGSYAKPDGRFYKTIKSIGGGESFGTLLVSVFKDYGRRYENLSKIIYVASIMVLIMLFLTDPQDPFGVMIMAMFIFPMLAAFIVGEVTLRGKEALFIYKKAPSGVNKLLLARLIHGWIIAVPFAGLIMGASMAILPGIDIMTLLGFTGMIMMVVAAYVAYAMGLALKFPVFTEKESIGNIMIIAFTSMFTFMVPLIIYGETIAIILVILLRWSIGFFFLYLGKMKLEAME